MRYLLPLLALNLLVIVHELGHLLCARLMGLRIERFALGFGPPMLSFRLSHTDVVLGAIPFGAGVRIAGMNPHQASVQASLPPLRRVGIFAAGPLANCAFAYLVLVFLYVAGTHVPVAMTVGAVVPGSEAARAQLKPGDLIRTVGGKPVAQWAALVEHIEQGAGQRLTLGIVRHGEPRLIEVRPRADGRGLGTIGVGQQYVHRKHGAAQALVQAALHLHRLAVELVALAVHWARTWPLSEAQAGLALRQVSQAASSGPDSFWRMLASFSVALALLHLLPLPSLDGLKIAFALWEARTRRPVPPRVETLLHAMGLLALVVLIALASTAGLRTRLSAVDEPDGEAAAPRDAGPH